MNIHHLELFYYVARHGGISAAVRRMPYGIQQPAVSGQILLLEEDLGVTLFQRQPFRLTPEGEELMKFIQPFFDNVEEVGVRLRKTFAPQLRIGAAEPALRDHLPTVIERVRASHPGIRLVLRSGFETELKAWLEERQIDLSVIPLRGRRPPHTRVLRLLRLPLVLLVPKKSKLKSAAELWARGTIEESLIGLPATESISVLFQNGLRRRGVTWPVATEASSVELITEYVANGYGLGANVALPEVVQHPRIRALPLDDFEPMELGVLWHGTPTPLIRVVLQEIQRYVREKWPDVAYDDPLK
jgi:DNA-binding transcriptional LysR family regulator